MAMEPKLIALKDDPRAGAGIRRAKSWGGLAGFAVTAVGSVMHGADTFDATLRALGAGIGAYLIVWAAAVAVWRHLVRAEAQTMAKAVVARHQARLAARAEASARADAVS